MLYTQSQYYKFFLWFSKNVLFKGNLQSFQNTTLDYDFLIDFLQYWRKKCECLFQNEYFVESLKLKWSVQLRSEHLKNQNSAFSSTYEMVWRQ